MKKLSVVLVILLAVAGCSLLPEKSPTRLEKSPCACGEAVERHV